MKKLALIIFLIFIGINAKSQNFGLTLESGQSWLTGISYFDFEGSPRLYYGIGLVYKSSSTESDWGYSLGINFDVRGSTIDAEGPTPYYQNGNYIYYYVFSSSTISTNSITLNVSPSLDVSEKMSLVLGPQYSYSLGSTTKSTSEVYENSDKQTLIETQKGESKSNGLTFIDKSSFGFKATINYSISERIDLGLSYQYSRLFKYGFVKYQPQYNIINLTVVIYLHKNTN